MPTGSVRARRPLPADDEPISIYWARELIRQRDEERCHYCGKTCPSGVVEHKTPVRRGGPTTLNNCVWACYTCNAAKRTQNAEEFAAYRQAQAEAQAARQEQARAYAARRRSVTTIIK